MIVTALWAALMALPTFEWLRNGSGDARSLAGALALVAVIGTAISVFLQAWPRAVARLKDKILVARLRAEVDAIEAGSAAAPQRDRARLSVFASGTAAAAVAGVAVNLSVAAVAFLFVGIPDGFSREKFGLVLFASGLPAITLAILWRTHEVTRLLNDVKRAELTATLKALDTSAFSPASLGERAAPDASVTAVGRVLPPPLPPRVGATAVTVDAEGRSRDESTANDPRWRARVVIGIAISGAALVATVGRVHGPRMFGYGLGLVLAAVAASLPFSLLFLVIGRRLWKRPWSYRAAYATHLAGVLVGVAPGYVADGLLAASIYYPYESRIGSMISTSVLPVFVWACARTADGRRIGVKLAAIAAVLLFPVGFAVGYASSRLLSA